MLEPLHQLQELIAPGRLGLRPGVVEGSERFGSEVPRGDRREEVLDVVRAPTTDEVGQRLEEPQCEAIARQATEHASGVLVDLEIFVGLHGVQERLEYLLPLRTVDELEQFDVTSLPRCRVNSLDGHAAVFAEVPGQQHLAPPALKVVDQDDLWDHASGRMEPRYRVTSGSFPRPWRREPYVRAFPGTVAVASIAMTPGDFVEALRELGPGPRSVVGEHLSDHGEVLLHLLTADLRRFLLAAFEQGDD